MESPQEQHLSTHLCVFMLSPYDFNTRCSVCTVKIILAFCWSAAYSAPAAVTAAAAKQDDYPDNAAASAAAESTEAVATVTRAAAAAAAAA